MERIFKAMLILEPGAMDNQMPVWIPAIREKAGIPQSEFNRLILEMALASGIIRLKKYPYPAQLTKQEKSEMVFNGEHFYSAATIRADAAERIAALAEPVDRIQVEPVTAETVPDNNRMPVEPVAVQTDQPDRMPVDPEEPAQIQTDEPVRKRGGRRPGAGRKAGISIIPAIHKRRAVTVKLPGWLADWLSVNGSMGKTIEAALIECHHLTPPT